MVTQRSSRVRLEWGPIGADRIVEPDCLAVVVDVLSFTTALTVAVQVGAEVYPYAWHRQDLGTYAAARDAHHAVGRYEAQRSDSLTSVSLSPRSLAVSSGLKRLVLPSPNGSTISFRLRDSGATVVGVSLRNRAAVAAWLDAALEDDPARVLALVAAGERWDDGSLRPAVEDLWGCGALLAGLRDRGADVLREASPEAHVALAAYDAVADDLEAGLVACDSGQELVRAGFRDDVVDAAQLDVSAVVPVLSGERFVDARRPRGE